MILFIVDTLDNEEDKTLILDIYKKYAPWLRARAYKYTKDIEESNDLVHDCIINLIKHVDKLRTFNDSQLRAYIVITIDNTAKNYIKKSSKISLATEDEEAFLKNLNNLPSTEDIVEKKLTYETIRQNFEKLSERDQTILILKYDLDLSDTEIAPIIGISENSVPTTIRRSIKRLGKTVKEVASDDGV